MMGKKAVVIHSGGLDSSLCLALVAKEFGSSQVLSLSFCYGQRHSEEVLRAKKICGSWNIDHVIVFIEWLEQLTESALIGNSKPIEHKAESSANTMVLGRNGLMARLGAIHAQHLGAHCIYMGIIEEDAKEMGYRDCTREYMNLKQQILRMDFADPSFEIRTPLVHMSKKQALELSYKEGILKFLLDETISCYEGLPHQGCKQCPTCKIRNRAIEEFSIEHPDFVLPWDIMNAFRGPTHQKTLF